MGVCQYLLSQNWQFEPVVEQHLSAFRFRRAATARLGLDAGSVLLFAPKLPRLLAEINCSLCRRTMTLDRDRCRVVAFRAAGHACAEQHP